MVAGGNLVVGLVVFLIITVVQFIVVAKGAERVAEVAARFTLDAMPGKQLSIDSDLRSGLIDQDEARRKRRHLEVESQLHGSPDGARSEEPRVGNESVRTGRYRGAPDP